MSNDPKEQEVEAQEEQEVDLDTYVEARNEGASPQEAFEQATNN